MLQLAAHKNFPRVDQVFGLIDWVTVVYGDLDAMMADVALYFLPTEDTCATSVFILLKEGDSLKVITTEI